MGCAHCSSFFCPSHQPPVSFKTKTNLSRTSACWKPPGRENLKVSLFYGRVSLSPKGLESWCAVEGSRQWKPVFRICHLHSPSQPHLELSDGNLFIASKNWTEILHGQPLCRENPSQLQATLKDFQDRGWLHWHLSLGNKSSLILDSVLVAALVTLSTSYWKKVVE